MLMCALSFTSSWNNVNVTRFIKVKVTTTTSIRFKKNIKYGFKVCTDTQMVKFPQVSRMTNFR